MGIASGRPDQFWRQNAESPSWWTYELQAPTSAESTSSRLGPCGSSTPPESPGLNAPSPPRPNYPKQALDASATASPCRDAAVAPSSSSPAAGASCALSAPEPGRLASSRSDPSPTESPRAPVPMEPCKPSSAETVPPLALAPPPAASETPVMSAGLLEAYGDHLRGSKGLPLAMVADHTANLTRLLRCVLDPPSPPLSTRHECATLLQRRGTELADILRDVRGVVDPAFFHTFLDWVQEAFAPSSSNSPPSPSTTTTPAPASASASAPQFDATHDAFLSLCSAAAASPAPAVTHLHPQPLPPSPATSASPLPLPGVLPIATQAAAASSGGMPAAMQAAMAGGRKPGARRGRPPGSAAVNFLAPQLKMHYQEWLVSKKGLTALSSTQYCNSIGLVIKDLYEPGMAGQMRPSAPGSRPVARPGAPFDAAAVSAPPLILISLVDHSRKFEI